MPGRAGIGLVYLTASARAAPPSRPISHAARFRAMAGEPLSRQALPACLAGRFALPRPGRQAEWLPAWPASHLRPTPTTYADARPDRRRLELAEPVAVTLVRRGYRTAEQARAFLAADERHDPFEFDGIDARSRRGSARHRAPGGGSPCTATTTSTASARPRSWSRALRALGRRLRLADPRPLGRRLRALAGTSSGSPSAAPSC